jgi:kumamolisin
MDAACQSAAALGITITVAAGDDGSTDGGTGNNVDFPASSPHVLACGGTKLVANGATIASEVVWNELANNEGATGGGVSNVFALPAWQAKAQVPASATSTGGRGVPDVACRMWRAMPIRRPDIRFVLTARRWSLGERARWRRFGLA